MTNPWRSTLAARGLERCPFGNHREWHYDATPRDDDGRPLGRAEAIGETGASYSATLWCRRWNVFVSPKGAACVLCRRGERPAGTAPSAPACPVLGEPADLFACPRYRVLATGSVCARCRSDPLFKQAMYDDYVRNRAGRDAPCRHATGEPVRREAPCCGGARRVTIQTRRCERRRAGVSEPDCWTCPEYAPAESAAASHREGPTA